MVNQIDQINSTTDQYPGYPTMGISDPGIADPKEEPNYEIPGTLLFSFQHESQKRFVIFILHKKQIRQENIEHLSGDVWTYIIYFIQHFLFNVPAAAENNDERNSN
jgi:hypothetical protein